ncbi:hypothetical protein HZH66_009221 [Vespula vulgaris]|uniref:Uncharacterized protein n=1 Tax=Vespula vulgaris TaxID=7454 RepID=A0A834JLM1_VESVU|nr:hypothetical protein HZH66_009221 [Vespula vulgaris]
MDYDWQLDDSATIVVGLGSSNFPVIFVDPFDELMDLLGSVGWGSLRLLLIFLGAKRLAQQQQTAPAPAQAAAAATACEEKQHWIRNSVLKIRTLVFCQWPKSSKNSIDLVSNNFEH